MRKNNMIRDGLLLILIAAIYYIINAVGLRIYMNRSNNKPKTMSECDNCTERCKYYKWCYFDEDEDL